MRLCTLLAAAALSMTAAHAQMIPLPDWQFSRDSLSWDAVSVPHSYNAVDGRSPHYYRGKGYYRTEIDVTKNDLKTPLTLYFEGAAQAATVYVNGHVAMHHKGGYTPFAVNVTPFAHKGTNEVIVVCDNSVDPELAPIDSDFNKNGGLHNPVNLVKVAHSINALRTMGKSRIHVNTVSITDDAAELLLTYDLGAFGSEEARGNARKFATVNYRILGADGEVVYEGTEKARPADLSGQSTITLPPPSPLAGHLRPISLYPPGRGGLWKEYRRPHADALRHPHV